MTATITFSDFDRRMQPRERNRFIGGLALRQRSNDHPVAMFSIAAAAALLSMAFIPTSGPALASFSQPAGHVDEVRTTTKTSRLPAKGIDACQAQAWGSESGDCLVQIARESGKSESFRVRKLALAASAVDTPTVF